MRSKKRSLDKYDMLLLSDELKENGTIRTIIESNGSWLYVNDEPILYFTIKMLKYHHKQFRFLEDFNMYRISMTKPEYIHSNDKYNRNVYMSKEQKAKLLEIINKEGVWKSILLSTNNNKNIIIATNINDHHDKLVELEKVGKPWTDIPEDLPMPDYSLLPTRN